MIEKIEVPRFGREEVMTMPDGTELTSVIMEDKESEIIALAEKVNEIVDYITKELT